MDFGKYKYEEEKKNREARKHHTSGRLKEVKFHANVEPHDYQTKLRHIRDFILEGHRIKVSLYFRGRENAHQELGFELMNRVMRDLEDVASPEQIPTLMGRALLMMLGPRRGLRQQQSPRPPMPGPGGPGGAPPPPRPPPVSRPPSSGGFGPPVMR